MKPHTGLLLLALAGPAAAQPSGFFPTVGRIERKDPRLDDLLAKDTFIEKVSGGFDWAEGPVWDPVARHLLLSDIPKNTVWKWTEEKGAEVFLKPSGYTGKEPFGGREPGSNGLAFDREGRLVLCQHGDRRIVRIEKDGKQTILADRYQGKRLNSPNDLVYSSAGDLYFTDPPYGLPKQADDPGKELDFQGVYRLTPKGELTLLTKELSRPNGIGLSPDEKTLYVANSDLKRPVWMAYPLKPDGTIGEGRVFFDATKLLGVRNLGVPDGLKVDAKGNLFATGPGGVLVLAPDGTHLGTIRTGGLTANCAWGERRFLYIAADKTLCRVLTRTGPPPR